MPTDAATRLLNDLAAGIASGRHAVGALLPTELELCERYGASRYATRLVLAQLQERGLISRRRNVGTRVEAQQARAPLRQTLASVADLAQFGAAHARLVKSISSVLASAALARELGCAPGARWLRVSSLRVESKAQGRGHPVCWTDAYIDGRLPGLQSLEAAIRAEPGTLISTLLEARHGLRIVRIRQDMRAVAMPRALAARLHAQPGEPALRVVRSYFAAGDAPFEVTLSIHPAARSDVSMELIRGG